MLRITRGKEALVKKCTGIDVFCNIFGVGLQGAEAHSTGKRYHLERLSILMSKKSKTSLAASSSVIFLNHFQFLSETWRPKRK